MALVCSIALAIPYPSDAQNSPQDILDAHNAARAQVRVGNMTRDSTVAASAQSYANQRINDCPWGISGTFAINRASKSYPFTGVDAVQAWVSGKTDYDYNSNSCINISFSCLTYVNVVWSNSTRLGCDRLQCRNNRWFVICNYDPPSDFPNERPY